MRASSACACARSRLRASARLSRARAQQQRRRGGSRARAAARGAAAGCRRCRSQLAPDLARRAGRTAPTGGTPRRALAALASLSSDARRDRVAHQLAEQRALQVEHRAAPARSRSPPAPSPSNTASVRSWKSGARRRCSAGETHEAVGRRARRAASTSSASRCVAAGTGCSGSRPLPGKSRSVRTPPIWRASTPAGAADVAQRVAHRAAQHRVVLVAASASRVSWRLSRSRAMSMRLRANATGSVPRSNCSDSGIDAEEVVLVGAVGQLRLGAARRRCAASSAFLARRRDRLVGVLDRPVVVRARAWSGTACRRVSPGRGRLIGAYSITEPVDAVGCA